MFSTKANRSGERVDAMPSIIADGMRVVGEISGTGDVQVDGTLEGDIRAGSLTVGPSGKIVGEISAERVSISGTVTGRVRARIVSLSKTARVRGDIAHESLSIEAGALFEGLVTRMDEKRGAADDAVALTPPRVGRTPPDLPAVAAEST